jgi:hypothetical protein
MGLRQALHQRKRPPQSPTHLATHLQSPPPPHRNRRTTRQPRTQPLWAEQLVLEHFVPWDAVVDVLARGGRTPWITVKAMPTSGMRERKHTGRLGAFEAQFLPFMVARTMWLGANALPAYRALRHYFEHPEERIQLSAVDQPVGPLRNS